MARQWWALALLALAGPSHADGGGTSGSRALAVRGGAKSNDNKFSITVPPAPGGLPYDSFDATTLPKGWEPYPTYDNGLPWSSGNKKEFGKKVQQWTQKWNTFHETRKLSVYETMFLRGRKPNEDPPFPGLDHPNSRPLRTRFATFDRRKNLDPKAYNYFSLGDVKFIKARTGCSDEVAIEMIDVNGGNLINAIMQIENLGLVDKVEGGFVQELDTRTPWAILRKTREFHTSMIGRTHAAADI